jgi:hypothetical protein
VTHQLAFEKASAETTEILKTSYEYLFLSSPYHACQQSSTSIEDITKTHQRCRSKTQDAIIVNENIKNISNTTERQKEKDM